MGRIRILFPIFIVLLVLLSSFVTIKAIATPSPMSESETKALEVLNEDRHQHGLKPLKPNLALAQVARRHAIDMMKRSYFAHETPEGINPFTRMKKAGIKYTAAGENLYKGLNDPIDEDVIIAEQFLMASPGHRRNILDSDFTEVGIGIVRNEDGWMYLVQCFIRPR